MSKPTFQIVTTDNQAYTQGTSQRGTFIDLNGYAPCLESYEHDGDYLQLRYSDGFRQLIPEHRIKHIAYLDQD
ncbi:MULTISPECIES: hypothetical protein [unclassified Streptomyces]|uniref:hypothetical protein n=1 Tax=unclassified Streptomyces TaxID=2593676 RepID=UPI00224DDC1F|nr:MULTISPECIES: hypothetical protein [unclassified Streptomyces]MCX4863477.1 hypothetical protein [Streptomyces sp. NBC_00906]MCX4894715.1 hypothetical protein [Streptomyces sp. NBC_00892]